NLANVYLNEAVLGTEALLFAYRMSTLNNTLKAGNAEAAKKAAEALKPVAETFFKDYHMPADKKVFAALMKSYHEDIAKDQQPEAFKKLVAKYKGDFNKLADYVYGNSFVVNKQKTEKFLNNPTQKQLANDPAFALVNSIIEQ